MGTNMGKTSESMGKKGEHMGKAYENMGKHGKTKSKVTLSDYMVANDPMN